MAAACNVVNLIVLGALKAGLLDVEGVEGVERGAKQTFSRRWISVPCPQIRRHTTWAREYLTSSERVCVGQVGVCLSRRMYRQTTSERTSGRGFKHKNRENERRWSKERTS